MGFIIVVSVVFGLIIAAIGLLAYFGSKNAGSSGYRGGSSSSSDNYGVSVNTGVTIEPDGDIKVGGFNVGGTNFGGTTLGGMNVGGFDLNPGIGNDK